MEIEQRTRQCFQMHFGFSIYPEDESKSFNRLLYIGLIMLADVAFSLLLFASQLLDISESVSGSKRVVLQRFFGNLDVFCYGTCSQTSSGFVGVTKDVRCQGKQLRLACQQDHVIKISLAFYGELDPGKELCRDVLSVLEQCRTDVTQIVGDACNNKRHCLFKIGRRKFKDKCQTDYFYLDVRHSCVFQPSTPKPTTERTTEKTTLKTTTTKITTTKKLTSAAKPITIYKDTTRKRTEPTLTKTSTKKSSSKSKPVRTNTELSLEGKMTSSSSSSSSSKSSSSTSSSTGDGTMSKKPLVTLKPLTRMYRPKQKINSSVIINAGRTGKKKASMYWFLTAYSLVTDKSFMQANSTHMSLAIILSIFIAMVILTCFILDHCRRKRRYESLNESKEAGQPTTPEPPQENGHSPMDLEIRRGQIRPKGKLRAVVSTMTNGAVAHKPSRSLDDINQNTARSTEKLSLLPLSASLDSVERSGIEETSFLAHSSLSDCLPPPPEELLLDSPQQNRAAFCENESDSSLISIPPPPEGFGDSDNDETHPFCLNPKVIITSPTDSSVSSTQTFPRSRPLLKTSPKVNNSGRLNNELHHGCSTIPRDNLLQNHVCVQTNDLSKGSDKQPRIENPGYVSMRSPEFELPDLYSAPDLESKVGCLDSIDEMILLKLNNNKIIKQKNQTNLSQTDTDDTLDDFFSSSKAETLSRRPRNTKGQLIVLKGGTTENQRKTVLKTESKDASGGLNTTPQIIESSINEGNVKGSIANKNTRQLENESLKETTTGSLKAKQFAVPKHRCGQGHSHTCQCTPVRTSGNSYICSCLEKAKQNETKCCVENCADETEVAGIPYSSARPSRRPQSETMKRKCNRERRLSSSLTDITQLHEEKHNRKSKENGIAFAALPMNSSATLPRPSARNDKKLSNDLFSKSLDRQTQQRVKNKTVIKEPQLNDQYSERSKTTKKTRFERTDSSAKEAVKPFRSNIPSLIRSEESSDSSERSDISIEAVQSKSLPTSPTKRLKNGRVRLSPISEDSMKSQRNKSPVRNSRPKQSPRFKIQVVQSLHTNKHHPIKEV